MGGWRYNVLFLISAVFRDEWSVIIIIIIIIIWASAIFPPFIEPKDSLPSFRDPAVGSHSQPHETSPRSHTV
jgi:hypothetical protein